MGLETEIGHGRPYLDFVRFVKLLLSNSSSLSGLADCALTRTSIFSPEMQPRIRHLSLKPSWIRHLPRFRAALVAAPTAFLDRQAIQQLFGVRPRQANYILASLPDTLKIGRATIASREQLLHCLDQIENGHEYKADDLRRHHLREAIGLAQLQQAARKYRFRKVTSPQRIASLPQSVRVAPGVLEVSFTTVDDLLSQLHQLLLAIGHDAPSFERLALPEESGMLS